MFITFTLSPLANGDDKKKNDKGPWAFGPMCHEFWKRSYAYGAAKFCRCIGEPDSIVTFCPYGSASFHMKNQICVNFYSRRKKDLGCLSLRGALSQIHHPPPGWQVSPKR